MGDRPAWQITAAGVRLRVRVTPRAGRDRLEEMIELPDGPAVKIAVSAPPEDGKANAAVAKLLAKFFRTAKSNITISSGASSRTKLVDVAGDGAALAVVLDAWAAATRTGGGANQGSGR